MDKTGQNSDFETSRDTPGHDGILPPVHRTGTRYLMIESAEIQNFRGFRHTQLKGFSRFNVVVGDNGVGKTALLEAFFLAVATNAEVATRFRGWRGADNPGGAGTAQEIYDGLFLDLFHKMQRESVPAVSLTGTVNDSRSVRVYYDVGEPTVLPLGADATHPAFTGYTPVTFEWKDARGQITKATPRLQPSGLTIPPRPPSTLDPVFMAARTAFPTTQNARWFSEFSKRGRETRFFQALKAQFDYIQSLTVEVDMGNPVLFIKTPWIDSKIPIYLASDGLNKIMTLLLYIAHATRTAIFVDEIENGIHHSRHAKLWEQLLSFAEEYDTQIFAATHSWEFLRAGAPLIEKFPDDFALLQVTQEDGISDALVVHGKSAGAAIASGLEVRARRK